MLRIIAKRAGFRRSGRAHPDTPVDHPAGTFSAAEIAALKAEPMLVVIDMPDPDPAGADTGAAATKSVKKG